MSFVVDNSVALAWCFEDEQTRGIMALLDRVADTGAVAPQLWPIEALNGLLTAERRGRIDPEVRQRLPASSRSCQSELMTRPRVGRGPQRPILQSSTALRPTTPPISNWL